MITTEMVDRLIQTDRLDKNDLTKEEEKWIEILMKSGRWVECVTALLSKIPVAVEGKEGLLKFTMAAIANPVFIPLILSVATSLVRLGYELREVEYLEEMNKGIGN